MRSAHPLLIALAFSVSIFTIGTGCKKEKGSEEKSPVVQGLVTPVGASKGQAVTKQIGNAGGSITSADQQITVMVPAGALSGNTTIGIEPIANTNIAGMGTAYRLTPHGQHFDKPVTITFSWAAHADTIGLLQTLGLAYQMENGIWKFVGSNSFDKANKTVTFNTTHFSDWSLMNQLSLVPYQKDVDLNEKLTIAALLFTAVPDDNDGLFVPLPGNSGKYDEPGYPVGNPVPLPNKYMKQWRLNGPGSITNIKPTVVEYTAPASANGYTTAAVSLELKAPAAYTGQYLLVSNINILLDFIELSVGGGTPVILPATPVVKSGDQYILGNQDNTGGGYFMLTWTEGIGVHKFDLSNTGTHMHFITPQTSYVSMYKLRADDFPAPSGGSVNVTRVTGGWAEGTFIATEAGISPALTSWTTLQGRFKVKLAQ